MNRNILLLIVGLSSILCGSTANDTFVSDNFTTIVALVLLAIVSVVMLYVSSEQLKKNKKLYQEILEKQKIMEDNQTGLLTNMSENISKITKEAIKNRNNILKNSNDKSLEYILSEVIETENTLLDRTNDLIEFLKLKSKKIKITNEFFNLNNVLNEMSGSLSSTFKNDYKVELIYDIDNDIPRFLIGDSLHLGQVLYNLLEFSILQTIDGEVRLKVIMFKTFEEKTELQFQITDTGAGIESDKLDTLFDPHYDKEKGEYIGLGLFVANELVSLMGGELMVESVLGKGSTFTVVLPLQVSDPANRRKYRLPEKILTTKKVFIVDNSYNSSLAIKKMFAYFKHDVKVYSRTQFEKEMPNLEEYDIVVMNEELFTPKVIKYISSIKQRRENNDFKVLGLGSIFDPIENTFANAVIERRLKKPLNQERIFELIIELYRLDVVQKVPGDADSFTQDNGIAETIRGPMVEAPDITRGSFSEFAGNKLLIVEDNLINQKVLTNILGQSGIDITLANNGEEAVVQVTTGKKSFDLVLMDINMPIMDGYTATREIRKTGAFDDLPIVSFTALVLDSEVEKMYKVGINAFLDKPLNIGKLYTVFNIYMHKQGASKTKKSINDSLPPKRTFAPQASYAINVKEGIKHTNGNEALYMELLNEFISTYEDSDELFEKLLREHRYEQIKMLCLDMKGLAATIGAEDMYRKVDEIHKLFIYNDKQLLGGYLNDYKLEIRRLGESIGNYLDENKYSS